MERLEISRWCSKSCRSSCHQRPLFYDCCRVLRVYNCRTMLPEADCNRGCIDVYVVKDYSGNVGFSHRINLPLAEPPATYKINRLTFSNDGYVLLAVSQEHWYLWSVYGHLLASGGAADSKSVLNGASTETSTAVIADCCWGWSNLNIIIAKGNSRFLQSINLARNAVTQCYNTVSS